MTPADLLYRAVMQWHDVTNTPVILATPARKAVVAGPLRTEGGQPVRRFVKELIRCGQYVKQSEALGFTVTLDVLDHWVKTTAAYLSAGNKIPVPSTHTDNPEANRGWVVDVFAEGRSLFATIDLVGDGIKLAGTCDVSLYSPPELVDGHGNKYVRPIVHVALCTDPVIPGLAGFVPIETWRGATRETVKVPVLKLQEQIMPDPFPMSDPNAGSDSPATTPGDAIREAIKQQVVAILDDDSIDDAAAFKKIKDLFKARAKALGVLESLDEPKAEGVDAGAAAVAASRSAAAPDPFLLNLARENYTGKLNALVAAGKITPAVRDDLVSQHLSDGPLTLTLSSKSTSQLDGLVSALAKNAVAVPMGERTGPQSLALARSIPTGDEATKNRKEAGKELLAMTARAAGMKPPAA